VGFEVVTAVTMNITFCCDVTVYSLVYVTISTGAHDITSWKAVISIASNLVNIEMEGPINGHAADELNTQDTASIQLYN
jgi:hypothetical protein